jgi:hypothetical protein
MKKLSILVALFLLGCTRWNDEAAIKWIKQAPKPIICRQGVINGMNYDVEYTLIDASGDIYVTGFTTLRLPDTLKGEVK